MVAIRKLNEQQHAHILDMPPVQTAHEPTVEAWLRSIIPFEHTYLYPAWSSARNVLAKAYPARWQLETYRSDAKRLLTAIGCTNIVVDRDRLLDDSYYLVQFDLPYVDARSSTPDTDTPWHEYVPMPEPDEPEPTPAQAALIPVPGAPGLDYDYAQMGMADAMPATTSTPGLACDEKAPAFDAADYRGCLYRTPLGGRVFAAIKRERRGDTLYLAFDIGYGVKWWRADECDNETAIITLHAMADYINPGDVLIVPHPWQSTMRGYRGIDTVQQTLARVLSIEGAPGRDKHARMSLPDGRVFEMALANHEHYSMRQCALAADARNVARGQALTWQVFPKPMGLGPKLPGMYRLSGGVW